MLTFYNTLHRRLEPFEPVKSGHVGLYTCGPTVYNPLTLGNWRAFIFDDVLKRSLRFLGYEVRHAMNITDVGHLVGDGDEGEDKVERAAAREGKTAWDIAKQYEQQFREGMGDLHIARDTDDVDMIMPRATDHIAEQIEIVAELERQGFTYTIADGVYFDTSKFAAYGRLSGQPLEEKEEGSRVVVNPEKRQATDFALWKFSPPGQKRHMEWPSPWGVGFPGWHIECSAMARKYLGQPFDIHCGGVDHIAVHHENEIAQSEAAFGLPLAHYWLHNEFLLIDGGRMGKSLGNAYTLEDLRAHGFDPVDFRYFCLGAHYRSKLNFTWEALAAARSTVQKLRRKFLELDESETVPDVETVEKVTRALEDDLATPSVLAIMWTLLDNDEASSAIKRSTLLAIDCVLGLDMREWRAEDIPDNIQAMVKRRELARAEKDWQTSDRSRADLLALGWLVEDTDMGTVVRKAN